MIQWMSKLIKQCIMTKTLATKMVNFKVTEEQYQQLVKLAELEKRSISNYIKLKLELLQYDVEVRKNKDK